jgi:hypothetical protein
MLGTLRIACLPSWDKSPAIAVKIGPASLEGGAD